MSDKNNCRIGKVNIGFIGEQRRVAVVGEFYFRMGRSVGDEWYYRSPYGANTGSAVFPMTLGTK